VLYDRSSVGVSVGNWKRRIDELRRKVRDLLQDLAGATRPEAELVPVPVRVRRPFPDEVPRS